MTNKLTKEQCAAIRRELKKIGPKPGVDVGEFVDNVNALDDRKVERLMELFAEVEKKNTAGSC